MMDSIKLRVIQNARPRSEPSPRMTTACHDGHSTGCFVEQLRTRSPGQERSYALRSSTSALDRVAQFHSWPSTGSPRFRIKAATSAFCCSVIRGQPPISIGVLLHPWQNFPFWSILQMLMQGSALGGSWLMCCSDLLHCRSARPARWQRLPLRPEPECHGVWCGRARARRTMSWRDSLELPTCLAAYRIRFVAARGEDEEDRCPQREHGRDRQCELQAEGIRQSALRACEADLRRARYRFTTSPRGLSAVPPQERSALQDARTSASQRVVRRPLLDLSSRPTPDITSYHSLTWRCWHAGQLFREPCRTARLRPTASVIGIRLDLRCERPRRSQPSMADA